MFAYLKDPNGKRKYFTVCLFVQVKFPDKSVKFYDEQNPFSDFLLILWVL